MANIRQYAYFSLDSDTIRPESIAERIGLEPSSVSIAGSRHSGPPPVPRRHSWKLESGVSEKSRLDDHFEALLARLSSHTDRIQEIVATGEVSGCLTVVRYFHSGNEEAELPSGYEHDGFERLCGQHPLVGFGLEPAMIAFLAKTGSFVDFDEYCDE
jgi:hypothetical protein